MKTRLRTLIAATAATAAALTVATLPQASAAVDSYAYSAYAGGTKVTAVGTTISSDLTAESSIAGKVAASKSNKVAHLKVAGLAQVGAVDTDVDATPVGKGFRTRSHARTAGVNLLNGLIKATAVETTSTSQATPSTKPRATSDTEVLGLTIAGKKYPVNLPTNTGITIPGVASVIVNYNRTEANGNTVVTQGAGLHVTLLKPRNGIAAGAEIVLNPTFSSVQPATNEDGGAQLGGGGFGAYINADVGDQVHASTGYLGNKPMPLIGTKGIPISNTTAKVNVPGVLNASGIESTVEGTSLPALSESKVSSGLADLRLFPGLLGGLIQAKAVGSTAHTRITKNGVVNTGSFQFLNLRVAGKAIPVDIGKNSSIDVAGLGKVTLNEHKEVAVAGLLHGYQVTGLHIVLDTSRAGLPVGTDIQVGVAQSLVWG